MKSGREKLERKPLHSWVRRRKKAEGGMEIVPPVPWVPFVPPAHLISNVKETGKTLRPSE